MRKVLEGRKWKAIRSYVTRTNIQPFHFTCKPINRISMTDYNLALKMAYLSIYIALATNHIECGIARILLVIIGAGGKKRPMADRVIHECTHVGDTSISFRTILNLAVVSNGVSEILHYFFLQISMINSTLCHEARYRTISPYV